MATFFTDYFDLDPDVLSEYGAFNISLINDLPLFIDPFLLFNSKKQEYRDLHDRIIQYVVFLRDKASEGQISPGLLRAWYCFPEIKQTWLGFSLVGNRGSGLGIDFAHALHSNLHNLFPKFGAEQITVGSHLEKVCLIREGVGRDNISDFTTNLIADYLCTYTQQFARDHLRNDQRRTVSIGNARFNNETEMWEHNIYELPWINGDYVILTPRDLLTRDDNWINRGDLIRNFDEIPAAIEDDRLRALVSNYFEHLLVRHPNKEPTQQERAEAAARTIWEFPQLIDYYIRYKERHSAEATNISSQKVPTTEQMFIRQLRALQEALYRDTAFYATGLTSYDEARTRVMYLKDVVENKGGYRVFYSGEKPIQREQDLQVMFRLVWFGTPYDLSAEVNDGRGPADFKVSLGAIDKTIVEMKLAKNSHLKQNLYKQTTIYQKASDAKHALKVIMFFTAVEASRVRVILKELNLTEDPDIIQIDARSDNKPSGSKAR